MPMHARAWLGVALPKVQLRVPLELGEEGAPRQAEPVPGDEELGRWKCPVPLEDDRGSCIFEGDLHFWLAIAGGMRVVEVSCKVRRSWVGRSGRRGGVARETGRGEERRAEERYQSTFQSELAKARHNRHQQQKQVLCCKGSCSTPCFAFLIRGVAVGECLALLLNAHFNRLL